MKKILAGIFLGVCLVSFDVSLHATGAVAARARVRPARSRSRSRARARSNNGPVVINRLSKFEAASGEGDYASHIVFELFRPLYYEVEEIKKGERVCLYFPGFRLDDFKGLRVADKIKRLPRVKSVSIVHEKVPVPRVALTIDFKKDVVILRLTKMEDPNLLVFDIFDKPMLDILNRKSTTIRLTKRGAVKKKRNLRPKRAHIVVDAGHGGRDSGASSYGLKEKKFTLDIARRVYARLKKEGYRVFLTRNTDSYLSVVDRFQLAKQLKANLFVSVHVNAAAGLDHVSGVETHFLDGTPFFGANKRSRFLFVKNKKDRCLCRSADCILYDKITSSKKLSTSIQNSILSCLEQRKINVVNRGVKRTGFRTLLRSEVPSSIVEVGFITNKKEARRLTKRAYRNFLAQGICNGIKNFLSGEA